jgi:membrane-associated protease RseP (regulator of RpoE activity)
VVFGEAASYTPLLARLDQRLEIARPWSGLITVDTRLHQGVPVLRVASGSPAAKAGIEPGEVIQAMDGKPVSATAEILAAVASRRPGEKLGLHVKGAGEARAVELVLGESPQEIPLHEPTLLYNRVMMDLLLRAEGYPGTEQAAFAELNLSIAASHFGDFAAAHDHLMKARAELPVRAGLSQGTGLYYLGLALEKLGYKAQAVEAYKAAAAAKDATLFNNDGPAVAPIAARRAMAQ